MITDCLMTRLFDGERTGGMEEVCRGLGATTYVGPCSICLMTISTTLNRFHI